MNATEQSQISKRCRVISLIATISLLFIGIILISVILNHSNHNGTEQSITSTPQTAHIIIQNHTNKSLQYSWFTQETNEHNLAINGIDVVQYFNLAAGDDTIIGDSINFLSEYQGVQWAFIDQTNKDLFDADPEKYVPQFGGYCALAIAHGNIVNSDPNAWSIYDNGLYLNVNTKARAGWIGDADILITNGTKYWYNLGYSNPPTSFETS